MRRAPVAAVCVLVPALLLGAATPARAQAPKLEVMLGGVFTGPVSVGHVDAELIDPSGGTLTLFRTSNRMASGTGIEGLVSWRLRERMRVELGVGWGSADLESRVSGDFEDAESLSIRQGAHQFTADVALVYSVLTRGKWSVFLRGSGGGFREITSDRTLVDNGFQATVGAGAQVVLRDAGTGFFGRVGVRGEVRALARRGGIEFGEAGTRVSPAFVAGVVVGR